MTFISDWSKAWEGFTHWTTGIRVVMLLFLATFMMTGRAEDQNQVLTLSLGGIPGQSRSIQGSAGTALISADRSLEVNYGHHFPGTEKLLFLARSSLQHYPIAP